ncbi:hypothetical protein [Nocardia jejuensis]|uniref:hypothetical protein n=1 Tax=Nocardia jejuensis TaxID=328049 RepID=UPI00082EAAFA|nr:hypothetical protein [Nocardia jejuensis]
MRGIANAAVAAAVSVGALMGIAGQATAAPAEQPGAVEHVAGDSGSSSGSVGTVVTGLACVLQRSLGSAGGIDC